MRSCIIAAALVMFAGTALADSRILGIWESADGSQSLEIMDGFRAGTGPVLVLKKDDATEIGQWSAAGSDIEIKVGFIGSKVEFIEPNIIKLRSDNYHRVSPIQDNESLRLKSDPDAFIGALTSQVWRTSLVGASSVFKSTFSADSGVVESFNSDGSLSGLGAWGISSGVLKIADTIIVEARISSKYMIGIDQKDRFIAMKAVEALAPQTRTSLKDQREAFLNAMVSDTWQTIQWGTSTEQKFRPVEGPLKGRKIEIKDSKLTGSSVWEYSPSTGALKIGYTEYLGGIVVGDALALVKKNGDQVFFHRMPGGSGKSFTIADVKSLSVNENEATALAEMLGGQLQRGEYFYGFEFAESGREGFLHEWRSVPFTVRGQSFKSDIVGNHEVVYQIEDFLVLGDDTTLKRDASPSRLRVKTDDEVASDQAAAQADLASRSERSVVLKLTKADGTVETVALPALSMADIVTLEILVE